MGCGHGGDAVFTEPVGFDHLEERSAGDDLPVAQAAQEGGEPVGQDQPVGFGGGDHPARQVDEFAGDAEGADGDKDRPADAARRRTQRAWPRSSTPRQGQAVDRDQVRAADTQQAEAVDAEVADILTLSVATLKVGMGANNITTSTTVGDTATAERDLEGYFVHAQRILPDGSAAWYYNDLCGRGMGEVEAGVRLAAMAALGFKDVVERQAAEQIKTWRDASASAVARMPCTIRALVEPLWYLGSSPMHPTTVEARATYPLPPKRSSGTKSTRSLSTPNICTSSHQAGRRPDGSLPIPAAPPGRAMSSSGNLPPQRSSAGTENQARAVTHPQCRTRPATRHC